MIVHAVIYNPDAGRGGFDWYATFPEAVARAEEQEAEHGRDRILGVVPVSVERPVIPEGHQQVHRRRHVLRSSGPPDRRPARRVRGAAAPGVARPPTPTPREGRPVSSRPFRILLVDDDDGVADSISRAFRLRGCEVDVAGSVTAAHVGYLERGPDWYDVMVVDFELGDGTGLDFIYHIRGSDKAKVVLWSGLDRTRELEASGMTVDALLTKDASLELLDVIEGWRPC